jgi:hypothetical protein
VLRRIAPSPAAHASSAEREWISSGIVLFCVASITLWFLLAPDPRFGGAALHVLTITPGLLMFASQAEKLRLEPKVWRVITISGIALALLTSFEIATRSWPLSGDRDNFFSVRLGTPTVEVVPLQHFGVRPQVGDQCWLTRSPCSPYERKISVRNRGRWLMIEPLYRSE